MAYVFKNIDASDVFYTPFYAHKTIEFTDITLPTDVSVYQTKFLYGHQELNGTETSSGYYKFLLHNSLNQLYYENYSWNPLSKLEYTSLNQKRELNRTAIVFSIPQNLFGEKIKKNTVSLTVAGNTIEDDGYGNLIDITRQIAVDTLQTDINDYLIEDWNFNRAYMLDSGKIITDIKYTDSGYGYGTNRYASGSNIRFTDGPYGTQLTLNGSGSWLILPENDKGNFNTTDDYVIGMFVTVPISQSDTTSTTNLILSKGLTGTTPYKLEIYNDTDVNNGKLKFSRTDGQSITLLTSSFAVNDGIQKYVELRKNETDVELWINGIQNGSTVDLCKGDVYNKANVYLGYNFTGSIDELKIFDDSLTDSQVENLGLLESGSNYHYYVGNVFYKTGLIVITSPYQEYRDLETNLGTYSVELRGTRKIIEHEIICTVVGSEFSMTTNKTAADVNRKYHSFVTHSEFTPYVTQIGLYNDNNELLAIAKPSQAIKIPSDFDITFCIRFDE